MEGYAPAVMAAGPWGVALGALAKGAGAAVIVVGAAGLRIAVGAAAGPR